RQGGVHGVRGVAEGRGGGRGRHRLAAGAGTGAGGVVAVAGIGGGDGVGADGEVGDAAQGRGPSGEGDRAAPVGTVDGELDGAGDRALDGRGHGCRDVDALPEDRGVGRGLQAGRRRCGVDLLAAAQGPRGGVEVGIAAVDGGDRVGAGRQRGDGRGGEPARQGDRRAEVGTAVLELHGARRRAGAGGRRRDGGREADALAGDGG